MEQPVLFELHGSTAVITLNRPERRNAINQALLAGLYDSLDAVTKNDEIFVAIITGNGKSFCSGIDLEVLGTDNLFNPRGDGKDLPDVFAACHKPIIAAVNGHAITGGFEIALNCDFIIASEHASFADTHARVGIHPGWGMTQLLQQAVGVRKAKQISLTCQFITAQEAFRMGLVNEIVPQEQLLDRTMKLAEQIVSQNNDMIQLIKELIEYRGTTTHLESFAHERKGFREFVVRKLDQSLKKDQ